MTRHAAHPVESGILSLLLVPEKNRDHGGEGPGRSHGSDLWEFPRIPQPLDSSASLGPAPH